MKTLKFILLALLVLMSVAAGVPKVLQMQQELEFLAHLGLDVMAVTLLGVIQLAGGILLVPKKTRLSGAVLAAIALLVSAAALMMAGNSTLGMITLLPIAIAMYFIVENVPLRARGNQHRGKREPG